MNIDEKLQGKLVEDTTGAAEPNIATTDENLSIDGIFQQFLLPSLGRQIFSVVPINGPSGAIFNLRKKSGSNDFELVRGNVSVYPSESIKTGITHEAIEDIYFQYGKDAGNQIIGELLRGLANEQENTKTMEFLEAQSKDAGIIQVSSYGNAEINFFEITQPMHQAILEMNNKNLRTYSGFVVLPATVLGGIMGLRSWVGADKEDHKELFITEIGDTRFYLNPDPTSNMAYVGLKSKTNSSKSSAIFSPYQSSIIEALDYDSGEPAFFIYNRFAITASPLHVLGDEMLYKFQVA